MIHLIIAQLYFLPPSLVRTFLGLIGIHLLNTKKIPLTVSFLWWRYLYRNELWLFGTQNRILNLLLWVFQKLQSRTNFHNTFFMLQKHFRILWLGNLLIQKRSWDGCLKKCVVMLKLFLTALLLMSQKWVYFIDYHDSPVKIWCCSWDQLVLGEQAVVLCQVEKAKEDMLNQLYSSVRLVLSLLPIFPPSTHHKSKTLNVHAT